MPRHHPSYRFHKARNCAVVTLDGRDHYLGAHGSPASLEKYHRLVAEWLAHHAKPPTLAETAVSKPTIDDLVLAYWRFVTSYYVKDGRPTSEQDTIRQVLRFLRRLFGSTVAEEFSPKDLKAVRQAMVEHPITRVVKIRNELTGEVQEQTKLILRGLARKFINKQIARIRRMFAWAVEEELVPVHVHQALLCVKNLKKGKSAAREKPRIKPVADAHVEAVLPFVRPSIKTMIQVQLLCGGRPQDIVQMRAIDIDSTTAIWEYHPGRYKTEHRNDGELPDKERVVYLGPRAQELLKPYLAGDPEGYLFSPRRSEEQRCNERRLKRQTPLWPSHVRHQNEKRQEHGRPHWRDHYSGDAYRKAVRRACLKAGIPIWHPNQLRHSRLTQIRKLYGLEASKVCAGHSEIGVTQHYAEQDRSLAYQVMATIG
jgi:integrase